MKKIIVLLLVLAMMPLGGLAGRASAAVFNDVDGHWAQAAIERWNQLGIVQGANNKYRPDDTVSRAELSAMINRIFKFPVATISTFKDITPDAWYYDDMVTMARNKILADNENYANGDQALTRAETAYMLSRAFIVHAMSDANHVADYSTQKSDMDTVPSAFKRDVWEMVRNGFMQGYPDNTFRPNGIVTRAEIATILSNMIDDYITQPGVYDQPLGKKVLVAAEGVTLKDQDTVRWIVLAPGADGTTVVSNTYKAYISAWAPDGTNGVTKGVTIENKPDDKYVMVANYHIYKGPTKEGFTEGKGSDLRPFEIANEEQLNLLRNYLGEGKFHYYKIIGDIELTKPWEPIGALKDGMEFADGCFYGDLNGNGHTVSGLNIDMNTKVAGSNGQQKREYVGLFHYLAGTVRNLTLEGTISVNASLDDAALFVGAFAGGVSGDIRDSKSNVDIQTYGTVSQENRCTVDAGGFAGRILAGGRVTGSQSTGTIKANLEISHIDSSSVSAGGIAGFLEGSITTSKSYGKIRATGGFDSHAGGITGIAREYGESAGKITDCSSFGEVTAEDSLLQNNAGGIVGHMQKKATLKKSFSTATVKGIGTPGYFNAVGGIAGAVYEGAEVSDCYFAGTVDNSNEGGMATGGVVGRMRDATISNSYTVGSAYKAGRAATVSVVGSVSGGQIIACADFSNRDDGQLLFASYDGWEENIEEVNVADIFSQDLYTSRGWNFEKGGIWCFDENGEYRLPRIRAYFKEEQAKLKMPEHISA